VLTAAAKHLLTSKALNDALSACSLRKPGGNLYHGPKDEALVSTAKAESAENAVISLNIRNISVFFNGLNCRLKYSYQLIEISRRTQCR